MSNIFYTSIDSKKNDLFLRGYRDGKPFKEEIKYKPFLFMSGGESSDYKTIYNENVDRVDFESISDARDFIDRYEKIEGVNLYGLTDFKYVYLYDNYKGEIEYNFNTISTVALDIETDSTDGFGDIDLADKPVTAITMAKGEKTVTFGLFDYTPKSNNNLYIKCKDEIDLLNMYLTYWNMKSWRPDIVTGWNCKFYDIRYLINRMRRILPKDEYLRMSPFRIVHEYKEIQKKGKQEGKTFSAYNLFGIQTIDYYELYKKFSDGERENYTLDFIASYELEDRKVDYSKYGSLGKLYTENKDLFYTYNIHDTILISRIEAKLHYIEQVIIMAYIIKCNFENVLKTVKPWDILTHNYLMDQKIVVPMMDEIEERPEFMGGFCKEPVPGLYHNVMSLDFKSLYPSVAISLNISPDMIVGQSKKFFGAKELLSPDMVKFTTAIKEKNFSLSSNGCFFRKIKQGFFPAIMQYFFDERSRFRDLEKVARKEHEDDLKSIEKRNNYLKLKNIQTAYKLLNNSGYGALGNIYCRWFDKRLAEAITSTGQLTAKYIAIGINEFLNKTFNTKDFDYVIYQDTDSAYINLNILNTDSIYTIVEFTQKVLQPEVDRLCEDFCNKLNAYQNKLYMKLEKVASKAFFIAKKRYSLNVDYDEGIYYDKPDLKIIGFEPKRSSVPKVCREAMEDVYRLIFSDSREDICKYIDNFKKKFYKMGFNEIGAPTSVNGLYSYYDENTLYKKHTPVHVKGSLFYNKLLYDRGLDKIYEVIYDHDKVRYCYLIPENPTKQPVISIKGEYPSELGLEQYIDYDRMWLKTFIDPIENICSIIKYKTEIRGDLNEIFA